jgi:hypothetical protein
MAWDSRHSGRPNLRLTFCQLGRNNLNNTYSLGGTLSSQKKSARLILKISALLSALGYLRHLLMIKSICVPTQGMVREQFFSYHAVIAKHVVVSSRLDNFSLDDGNGFTAFTIYMNPAKPYQIFERSGVATERIT